VEHRVPQEVGRELAKQATMAAFAAYAERYGHYRPKAEWVGDYKALVSFRVQGFELCGTVEFREREIGLAMDLPMLLRPLRAKALGRIERELELWCGRAKAGLL
jgi:hypothetical protein